MRARRHVLHLWLCRVKSFVYMCNVVFSGSVRMVLGKRVRVRVRVRVCVCVLC